MLPNHDSDAKWLTAMQISQIRCSAGLLQSTARGMMATKNNSDIQMVRVERLAKNLIPHSIVFFDQNAPHGFIRFRIETQSGTVLAESDVIQADEIARWSDEELRQCIRTLGAGKI